MGGGLITSGNFCQVGWENTADDISLQFLFYLQQEIQRLYDAKARLPAAVSKGAAVFSL